MASRLSDRQALELIRKALGAGGCLTVSNHAAEELADEKFDDNDLRNAIRVGKIIRREPDMRGEECFTVEGPAVDNNERGPLGAVCKIMDSELPEVLVITAFDVSTGYGRASERKKRENR